MQFVIPSGRSWIIELHLYSQEQQVVTQLRQFHLAEQAQTHQLSERLWNHRLAALKEGVQPVATLH